jgi:hypothetical protein
MTTAIKNFCLPTQLQVRKHFSTETATEITIISVVIFGKVQSSPLSSFSSISISCLFSNSPPRFTNFHTALKRKTHIIYHIPRLGTSRDPQTERQRMNLALLELLFIIVGFARFASCNETFQDTESGRHW